MARVVGKLTALKVARELPAGMYADGAGLYLQVTSAGAKSWIYRFSLNGKAREMGLGSLSAISLADARLEAGKCRRLRQDGRDPIEARKAERAQRALDAAKALTFSEAAASYVAAHRAGWKNAKHAAQWESTLATYAAPVIGKLSVQAVDTDLVLKVLEPIWKTKPETAVRVRGRIEAILDWAKVRGLRQGENPARWRGHLDHLLPARSKVRKVRPHPALPYAEVGTFMADLRSRSGIAARALELVILCAARTGDIIGNDRDDKPPMQWSHVDLAQRVWTIPSTKTDTEHRVPLSDAAVALLREMKTLELGEVVFPGEATRRKPAARPPLSNMAMTTVIRRMNEERVARKVPRYVDPKQGNRDITVHGFRSTFRDWAAERTNFPSEVVEMSLAHAVGDKVEAAYRRGDLFDKRRQLMAEWATYCGTPAAAGDNVTPIRAARSRP
jgi:integrase